jgi:exonuclease VII small subunit
MDTSIQPPAQTKPPVKVMTYEERVAKMKKFADCEYQLTLAKKTVRRLVSQAKKETTLADKLRYDDARKRAEQVLRKLRQNIFDLEDKFTAP